MVLKVLELFSGYGGANFALTKAEVEHETIGYSDIEKCADYIYQLNHGGKALGDVTKIDETKMEDFDLLTGGFPCQSFSLAGKRQGFAAVNKGKLFFDIIRIAEVKKPRWMLLENVEGILSHDDGKTMEVVLHELKRIGYQVHWTKLYSKNHGTPQNRPRIWFACFREQNDFLDFQFPETEELKLTVKDLLEDEVDNKYYLTERQLEKFNDSERYGNHKLNYNDIVSPTLLSIGQCDVAIIPEDFKIADFRYDEGIRIRKDGTCPTLACSNSGKGLSGQPIIMDIPPKNESNKNVEIYDSYNNNKYKNDSKVSNTLKAKGADPNIINTGSSKEFITINKWRRLTPRECFRLMGFFDDEIKFGNLKDTKLYFLAGNGWDIHTASKIFIQMFKGNNNSQRGVFDYD